MNKVNSERNKPSPTKRQGRSLSGLGGLFQKDQKVTKTKTLRGKAEVGIKEFNLARELKVKPTKAINYLVKHLGEEVKKGELVAVKKGFSKRRLFLAPAKGVLDSLTEKGILRIKTTRKKKKKPEFSFSGETETLIGSEGWGNFSSGKLVCRKSEAVVFELKGDIKDQVLAFRGKLIRGIWYKAIALGAKGIICGGLPDKEFVQEIKAEVLLVNGEKKSLLIPLIILGKEGEISEEVWLQLKKFQGKEVFLEGALKKVTLPL